MDCNNPVVIYTDASRDEFVSGLGYTIHTRDDKITGSKFLSGNYTSMEAEFHALVEAVRVASQSFSLEQGCKVYTDCKPIVRKICGGPEARADWEQYRKSAHWLLNKFSEWTVNYISRESNTDAHKLAREALTEGRNHNV